MKSLIITIQFLTRIPINKHIDVTEDDFVKGVIYFPFIGLIIGAFNLFIYYALSNWLNMSVSILALGYIVSNTMITGGLHIDGLADTCDAIFSGRKKERMLEIMKDSSLGTFGAIAILLDYLARFILVVELTGDMVYYILLITPVIAKTVVVVLMYISKYARESGMGGFYLEKVTWKHIVLSLSFGTAIIFAFMGLQGIIFLLFGLVAMLIYRQYIYGKIQGMTGDTLGAANEIIEIAVLLLFVVLVGNGLL